MEQFFLPVSSGEMQTTQSVIIVQFLDYKEEEDSGKLQSPQETGQRRREEGTRLGGGKRNHPSGNENQIVTKASENKLPENDTQTHTCTKLTSHIKIQKQHKDHLCLLPVACGCLQWSLPFVYPQMHTQTVIVASRRDRSAPDGPVNIRPN